MTCVARVSRADSRAIGLRRRCSNRRLNDDATLICIRCTLRRLHRVYNKYTRARFRRDYIDRPGLGSPGSRVPTPLHAHTGALAHARVHTQASRRDRAPTCFIWTSRTATSLAAEKGQRRSGVSNIFNRSFNSLRRFFYLIQSQMDFPDVSFVLFNE